MRYNAVLCLNMFMFCFTILNLKLHREEYVNKDLKIISFKHVKFVMYNPYKNKFPSTKMVQISF